MEILYKIFHISFLQSNNSLCLIVSAEKIFKFQPIRNKNCPWWPCFCPIEMKWGNLEDLSLMFPVKFCFFLAQFQRKVLKIGQAETRLFREPFIDASYHVLVHLVMRFPRRILEINQSETRIAYGSCLLTDHDKMSNISWGLSIDASYQFRFIWPSSFREDF